ncbi:MAG: nitroreductase [Granulosicoccus sp.]|jgi:nitroreductase
MNSLLDTLHSRHSFPASQLTDPAPDEQQLKDILQCAITAPDHGKLHPWRFIVIRGSARNALADVFVEAAKSRDPDISEQKLERLSEKPLRSPLIVVIVTTLTLDHPKAPEIEQTLSAGAAVQLMQLGATATGFGSIWLSGENAYDENVKQALGIEEKDQITGFLYLGTPPENRPTRRRPELADHVTEWTASLANK